MRSFKIRFLSIVLFCSDICFAQNDSLSHLLDNVTVVRNKVTSSVSGNVNETLSWNMEMMHDLPKILGNADPMHYTQLLPGVQTCSEYDAGLYVQGCDNAHNSVSISGVPLYNVSHMLGFFSIFNASHFPQMRFSRSPQATALSSRLGGELSMELPNVIPSGISGEYSIGPMSSQGTMRIPVNKKSALFLSLRAAYLNLLYGPLLKVDGSQIKYDFHDLNATYLWKADERNILTANIYYGNDDIGVDDGKASYTAVGLKWGNRLASLQWEQIFSRDFSLKHTLYYTAYANRFDLQMQGTSFKLPSRIGTGGYKLDCHVKQWDLGMAGAFHSIQPQEPQLAESYNISHEEQASQHTQEYSVYAQRTHTITDWSFEAGVRGNLYVAADGEKYMALDPSMSVSYDMDRVGTLKMKYGWKHQYLFQTGFSNMGLPTEFWFSCGEYTQPQYAQNLSLSHDVELSGGDWLLSVELYYKRLWHQVEYCGNVLDFLYTPYQLGDVLIKGKGKNYGVNAMLTKRTGKLTGWLSYSWGRAMRVFEDEGYNKEYPASHERIHELNAVGTYRFNQHWSTGATCVLASGTPFTAPKHFQLINGTILSEFGEFNANRLRPYFRLDISVNYDLVRNKKKESGINLSIYNVTAQKNDIFYRLKIYENQYGYRPLRFLLRVLPSINYYCKF